jgi:drug/metabolite transporter (DMT)-like permease
VISSFAFSVNLWLPARYRPSALAGFFLAQPVFGVLVAALTVGDPLTRALLLASVAVAAGIGFTSR